MEKGELSAKIREVRKECEYIQEKLAEIAYIDMMYGAIERGGI